MFTDNKQWPDIFNMRTRKQNSADQGNEEKDDDEEEEEDNKRRTSKEDEVKGKRKIISKEIDTCI